MLAVYTAAEIKFWENYTLQHSAITNNQLMQNAAKAFAKAFQVRFTNKQIPILILCGKGNNGGDGLYAGKVLLEAGYNVQIVLVHPATTGSPDQQLALQYWIESQKHRLLLDAKQDYLGKIPASTLLIDAILGSGTLGSLRSHELGWVKSINNSPCIKIALDLPTGLPTDPVALIGDAVQADYTYTFACFKPAFVFPESAQVAGQIEIVDIGLHPDFLPLQPPWAQLITHADVSTAFKPRKRFTHKGSYGHLLLVAGRFGKIGAACLAAEAALRVGAGKITVHLPEKSVNVLQIAVPEAMVSVDPHPEYWTTSPDAAKYASAAVGPGLGTHSDTALAFGSWLELQDSPVVIDADGINLLAAHSYLKNNIPKNSILTPHMAEFDRLTGSASNWPIRLEKARQFAEKYHCYVLLKNAYSFICTPEGKLLLNTNGNPGMATAGSGDVLTGILAGLLAQGLDSPTAITTGVFLHGLAGDIAAQEKGQESLLARDIIAALPEAIRQLRTL